MANRVSFGSSVGKMQARLGCKVSSLKRVVSLAMPKDSANSSNKILMKIRDEEVVSSWLRWMTERTCHPIASVLRR